MSVATRKPFRLAALFVVLAGLSACTSTDDIQDAIGAINPFGNGKKTLPGERMPVLNDQSPAQMAKRKPVSIGGARSISSWTGAGGPTGNDPGNVALSSSGGARAWATSAAEVGAGGMTRETVRVFARPVSADGRVFVYDPNGNVTASSLDGGGRLWRAATRPADTDAVSTGGGVATDGARVYAATGYGNVVALDAASGGKVWEKTLKEPARGAPTVADGKVFVVSQANVIYALNAADGNEAWTFSGVPEIGGLLSSANPAVSGGIVVVPFSSGELVALDVKTGKAVWSDAIARASRSFAVSGLSDIAASPVIADGVVYATGVGSRTVAIGLKTGQRLWEQSVGSPHTPVVSGNAVFLNDLDDNLVALDRKSGEVLWSSRLPVTREKKKRTNWAGPVLAGSHLWLVSNEGGMIAVDPTSGTVASNVSMGDPAMIAPIAVGGKILVLSAAGNLAAYN